MIEIWRFLDVNNKRGESLAFLLPILYHFIILLENHWELFIVRKYTCMARTQYYGIKYPFSSYNNDEVYVDLNETHDDYVKSKVLHVLFTPKGQKIRQPEFGTELVKFIFEQSHDTTFDDLKTSIKVDLGRYVPEIEFDDISINESDNDEHERIVIVHYTIKGTDEVTSVAVNI